MVTAPPLTPSAATAPEFTLIAPELTNPLPVINCMSPLFFEETPVKRLMSPDVASLFELMRLTFPLNKDELDPDANITFPLVLD